MSNGNPIVWQVYDGTDCLAVFIDRVDALEFRDHRLDQITQHLDPGDDVQPSDLVVVQARLRPTAAVTS